MAAEALPGYLNALGSDFSGQTIAFQNLCQTGPVDLLGKVIQMLLRNSIFALLNADITEEESTGVLQRLIEGKDLTLYGLSNAVTRFSQDVDSYDRATALEGIGYNILSMPRQQWNRINQMAA